MSERGRVHEIRPRARQSAFVRTSGPVVGPFWPERRPPEERSTLKVD
jgi:hypothetical protein